MVDLLPYPANHAEAASKKALESVFLCLTERKSFLLEAGAGAGKTYTLIKALEFLIEQNYKTFKKQHQKIACITYTNVAKDEINSRIDKNPLVQCDTIHGFCWSIINGFQKQLREKLQSIGNWSDRIEELGGIGKREIVYELGYRSIRDNDISIHHDDVLSLMIFLLENQKFRWIISNKYPVILIDEYQDTNIDWINAIKTHFLGNANSPQFGFFGDHWQKIYPHGCGRIEHKALTLIDKKANFRSAPAIVACLNRMRPELPQSEKDSNAVGSVKVFHTNDWTGSRQTGTHWKGNLPDGVAQQALKKVLHLLEQQGWDLSQEKTKILMLTHRVLASEQGYSSLFSVFANNDSFAKKENRHIAFFINKIEPACEAFVNKKYGEMLSILGSKRSTIDSLADKAEWSEAMKKLIQLRLNSTVGEVITQLRRTRQPQIPDSIERLERRLESFDEATEGVMNPTLQELRNLHEVPYREIIALSHYLVGHSPFETQHGVKGAEFENVLVVVGRGWNRYNFGEMLDLAQNLNGIPSNKREMYERNRNLFYVACSRPQKHLAILFTQELSELAIDTVQDWFTSQSLEALAI